MMRTSSPRTVKPYSILEKKLLELESILRHLFHPSSLDVLHEEATVQWPWDLEAQNVDIKKRIAFLKFLLAAEMECHSGYAPAHLQHIAARLAALDGAFSDRVDLKVLPPYGVFENATQTCSCDHECFRGPEIEEEEENVQNPDEDYFLEEEENVPKADQEYLVEEDEDVQEQESCNEEDREVEKPPEQSWCNYGRGRRSAAISARAVIAAATAAAMMVMAATFYGGDEERFYFVPT